MINSSSQPSFPTTSPLWYTMSSRVQLNQRGKELLLQQLTLSSEVTSSVLYGFSKLHRWRGKREVLEGGGGGKGGMDGKRAVETLLSSIAPSAVTALSVFLFSYTFWNMETFMGSLANSLPPFYHFSYFSRAPSSAFVLLFTLILGAPRLFLTRPILTLHALACSSFSPSLISHGLARWIHPTLSSSSLWCDTAWQCREE